MVYILQCGDVREAGPPKYGGKGVGKVAAWAGVPRTAKLS